MEVKKQYGYFSAAIRDGAKLRPQAYNSFYVNGATCAYGAGMDALGLLESVRNFRRSVEVLQLFPYLARTESTCPQCESYGRDDLRALIFHLNDEHKWTRERVADWLYEEEERLGFITVLDAQDACNTKDNNVTKDSQASALEEVFV